MSGMFDRVAKSSFLRRMDQMSELRKAFDLDTVIADFQGAMATEKVCRKYGVAISDADEAHVKKEWLDNTGWFKNPRNDEVLRKGLTEVVKKINSLDLPIDVYWVCYPTEFNTTGVPPDNPANNLGRAYPVEVYHTVSQRQITVIIVTPAPDIATPPGDESAMWVTKFEGGAVVTRPVKI